MSRRKRIFESLLYRLLGGYKPETRGEPQINAAHRCSVDLNGTDEHFAYNTNIDLGFANVFTIAQWAKFEGSSFTASTTRLIDCEDKDGGEGAKNRVLLYIFGSAGSGNDPFFVKLYDDSNTLFKHYEWDNFFTEGSWAHWAVTWDGTNLKSYRNGSEVAPTVKTLDNAGTMGANTRAIGVGARSDGTNPVDGRLHSTSIWNSALSANAIKAIFNHGAGSHFDLNWDQGDYASSSNLLHWWRHGFNPTDMGKDYGNHTTLIDIGTDSANITSADIMSDAPEGAYIDFNGTDEELRNSTNQSIGIANAWTAAVWLSPDTLTSDNVFFSLRSTANNNSLIQLESQGSQANDPFRAITVDTDGTTTIKDYKYNNFFTTGVWTHCVSTWDGTNLKSYRNGVEITADTKTADVSGSMADDDRAVAIGAAADLGDQNHDGRIHSAAVWNIALSAAAVKAIFNGGDKSINLSNKAGGYKAQDNLKHWWLCGQPTGSVGTGGNLVVDQVATGGINVETNAANITAADIIPASGTAVGVSVDFDGSTEYMAHTTVGSVQIANNYTQEILIKFDALSAGNILMFFDIQDDDSSNVSRAVLYFRDTTPNRFTAFCSNESASNASAEDNTTTPVTGVWYHLVAVKDGTTSLKLYVNGQNTGTDSISVPDTTNADVDRDIFIGADTAGNYKTNCKVHRAALWNSTLTADEVLEIFTHASSIDLRTNVGAYTSSADLVHYWKFGEDSSDIGEDLIAANAIDLMTDAANITASGVVGDAP